MSKKVYRTAQGRMVDLGALQLKNENVRAVGNMSVNARGDLIDSDNRPIAARNTQVAKQYGRQTTNVKDDTVVSSAKQAPRTKTSVKKQRPPEAEEQPTQTNTAPVPVTETSNTGGLAAAIARAREVKQEPILHPRSTGVKKV